jgi:F0F1-type ATP synthase membrane subunit c/vacuolar-type H+-ATPase subunit K
MVSGAVVSLFLRVFLFVVLVETLALKTFAIKELICQMVVGSVTKNL